jgi:hypothetical protein
MKKEGKVKHKLKQVTFRTVKKEVRKATSKKPCNCKHSGLVKGQASEPLFYVCLLESEEPKQWEGMICDPSVPNTCPFFKPSKTEEEIEKEVDATLKSGNMGVIASKYPDIAALLWVLSEEKEGDTDEED